MVPFDNQTWLARKSPQMGISMSTYNYGQSQFLMGKPAINGHVQ